MGVNIYHKSSPATFNFSEKVYICEGNMQTKYKQTEITCEIYYAICLIYCYYN